ncbi:hypothetical protein JVU11DRAFT_10654 [Chiua virens]|nr:hypothetical protein JVU11DRAFT_10654 [Chiua virens]
MELITQLMSLVKETFSNVQIDDHPWIAHLLITVPLQLNGYDCDVWLLVAVVAVLCGYDIMGLNEKNISYFCQYLQALVLFLPVQEPSSYQ